MSDIDDARYRKSERRIQDALSNLMATKPLTEISVSELSRKAGISRATFYSHYDNVGDVFDQLVIRTLEGVTPFEERFDCDARSCGNTGNVPYCERMRSESRGPLGGITKDARFFPTMMAMLSQTEPPSFDAASLSVSKGVAEALRLFQMSGCHAVATSQIAQCDYWPIVRDVLDTFIAGGLEAVRTRRRANR